MEEYIWVDQTRMLQPLRRLRFIEGDRTTLDGWLTPGCSLSGGCASLRVVSRWAVWRRRRVAASPEAALH